MRGDRFRTEEGMQKRTLLHSLTSECMLWSFGEMVNGEGRVMHCIARGCDGGGGLVEGWLLECALVSCCVASSRMNVPLEIRPFHTLGKVPPSTSLKRGGTRASDTHPYYGF